MNVAAEHCFYKIVRDHETGDVVQAGLVRHSKYLTNWQVQWEKKHSKSAENITQAYEDRKPSAEGTASSRQIGHFFSRPEEEMPQEGKEKVRLSALEYIAQLMGQMAGVEEPLGPGNSFLRAQSEPGAQEGRQRGGGGGDGREYSPQVASAVAGGDSAKREKMKRGTSEHKLRDGKGRRRDNTIKYSQPPRFTGNWGEIEANRRREREAEKEAAKVPTQEELALTASRRAVEHFDAKEI